MAAEIVSTAESQAIKQQIAGPAEKAKAVAKEEKVMDKAEKEPKEKVEKVQAKVALTATAVIV